jgi:hypothetical protein
VRSRGETDSGRTDCADYKIRNGEKRFVGLQKNETLISPTVCRGIAGSQDLDGDRYHFMSLIPPAEIGVFTGLTLRGQDPA